MNLENARATLGLTARSEMTAPGTSSSERQLIGLPVTEVDFSDADIIYSAQVTATGNADAASLTLSSGVITATNDSPTITDGDGKDFEAGTLPTLVTLYAVLVTVVTGSSDGVEVGFTHDGLPFIAETPAPATIHYPITIPGGLTGSLGTLSMVFANTGDTVTITILGKSS